VAKKSRKQPRVAKTAHALSENDVHYLVGFLYVVTQRKDIVVLGDRVLDVTTGTRRDVDIVVAGDQGILAVEVKDKGRPLDVGIVEGICMKYADMPQIQSRAIVSSSGYTEPAIKKARAHNVKCLSFVRGALPSSVIGADLSGLTHLTYRDVRWARMPSVRVRLALLIAFPYRTLPMLARLRTPGQEPGTLRTLGDLVAAMPRNVDGEGGPVELTAEIKYPLEVEVGSAYAPVASVEAHGVVRVSTWQTPLKISCYLKNEDGAPEASVVLFDDNNGLLGVATGQDGRASIIHIPEELRKKRPIKHLIGDRIAGHRQ
jgi:hypothetical protein